MASRRQLGGLLIGALTLSVGAAALVAFGDDTVEPAAIALYGVAMAAGIAAVVANRRAAQLIRRSNALVVLTLVLLSVSFLVKAHRAHRPDDVHLAVPAHSLDLDREQALPMILGCVDDPGVVRDDPDAVSSGDFKCHRANGVAVDYTFFASPAAERRWATRIRGTHPTASVLVNDTGTVAAYSTDRALAADVRTHGGLPD